MANGSNPQSEDLSPPWLNWRNWRLDGDQRKFMLGNLACDLAVILAILLSAAALLEWRRRRLASPWQFTLRELFLATFLVACLLSWCMVRRDQCRREQAEIAKIGTIASTSRRLHGSALAAKPRRRLADGDV